MNGFEGLKCTEEYLDTIDIKQEASEFGGSDLGDFMDFLEDKYGKHWSIILYFVDLYLIR